MYRTHIALGESKSQQDHLAHIALSELMTNVVEQDLISIEHLHWDVILNELGWQIIAGECDSQWLLLISCLMSYSVNLDR